MCVWLAASSLLMESMYGKDGGIIVISISSNYMCVCVCVCVCVCGEHLVRLGSF